MKAIRFLLSIFCFFWALSGFSKTLTQGDWKVDLEDSTGRFVVSYRGIPVNQKEFPVTSFVTLKVDDQEYRLGKDVNVLRVEATEKSLTVIYQITPQLIVEQTLSFKPHPFVYDEAGLSLSYRIDSRLDVPRQMVFRLVFDTYESEKETRGYSRPQTEKEVTMEEKNKIPTVIFRPFFIHAFSMPSFTYLTSWQRLEEEFLPEEKKLLNFRDIRTGQWDPAIGFFYQLGKISKSLNAVEFFVGVWQKPDRTYPRVKVYTPQEVIVKEGEEVEIPILVENHGDFDIDFVKLGITSAQLRQGDIQTLERLSKSAKKEIVFKDRVSEDATLIEGSLKATLWFQEKIYEQGFLIQIPVKILKTVDAGSRKESAKKSPEQKRKEAVSTPGSMESVKMIEKINLLLYFLNRGLESGISEEILAQIRKEVLEIESRYQQKTLRP